MKTIFTICFVILQFCHESSGIVGGILAREPSPDEPVVFTPNARIEGLRKSSNGLYSFLGIRFASPGPKRFMRPVYKRLAGDINATVHGPPCAQPDWQNSSKIVGSEDCLLLNIFTPRMPDESTGLPVIIFIHGGGFRYGSASQYGPDPLTDNRVIFVPIQYRLGTLGILGTGHREFPGNLALLDCAMAVQFVYDHITHFGGNANNIKIMGHGSGAVAAMYLTSSSFTHSLLSGVIAMSGSLLTKNSVERYPEPSVDQVAELNDCTGKSDDPKVIISCLRQRTLQELIRVDNRIESERLKTRGIQSVLTGFANFLPHVEERDDDRGLPGFLTEDPLELIKKKDHIPKIPLLIGVTGQETANAINLKTLEKTWGNMELFLKNLTASLGVEEVLKTVSKTVNLGLKLPSVSSYLKVPENISPSSLLDKITEVSTDVLFNLPIALVADTWSKVAPTYLYQFDYSSAQVTGKSFLGPLPLVSLGDRQEEPARTKKETVAAHGDELIYLFDVLDIFGRPLKANLKMTAEEKGVRTKFTKLITDFASLLLNNTAPTSEEELFKNPFTRKGSPYIQVNKELTTKSDFRFCTLSLWGAKNLEPLNTKNCDLQNILTPITTVLTKPLVEPQGGLLPKLTNTGLLGIL